MTRLLKRAAGYALLAVLVPLAVLAAGTGALLIVQVVAGLFLACLICFLLED